MSENTPKQPIIKIEVLGKPGIGKSTLACFIASTLRNAGLDTDLILLDGDADYVTNQLNERIDTLRIRNTKVVVTETTKYLLKDRLIASGENYD